MHIPNKVTSRALNGTNSSPNIQGFILLINMLHYVQSSFKQILLIYN